jgi:S1-C subfamily serine protease
MGGDIILEFGGKKITNIYDYMYAMNEHTPGDVVDVVVQRGEDKVKLKLELAAK